MAPRELVVRVGEFKSDVVSERSQGVRPGTVVRGAEIGVIGGAAHRRYHAVIGSWQHARVED